MWNAPVTAQDWPEPSPLPGSLQPGGPGGDINRFHAVVGELVPMPNTDTLGVPPVGEKDEETESVVLGETSYLRQNGTDRRWNFADVSQLPWDSLTYGPVDVHCQMYVEDIPYIHTAEETFRIVIDVSWEWVDDRILERTPGKPMSSVNAWRIVPERRESMWLPRLEIINAIEIEAEEQALEALVRDGRPKIVQGMKYSITAKNRMHLQRFPFDIQRLQLIIRSSVWPKRDMEFRLLPHQCRDVLGDYEPSIALNEFTMERSFLKLGEHTYPMTAILEGPTAGLYSEWRFNLDVRRRPNFYLFKIVFPFLLIIALNAMTMLCDASDIATRTSISITLFLTAVAFQLVVSGDMPKIAYATRLDHLMDVLYLLLSLSIVYNIVQFRLSKKSDEDLLWRIDIRAFGVFLGIVGVVSLWFLLPIARPESIDLLNSRDTVRVARSLRIIKPDTDGPTSASVNATEDPITVLADSTHANNNHSSSASASGLRSRTTAQQQQHAGNSNTNNPVATHVSVDSSGLSHVTAFTP
eukprot:TRINITY_DN5566_c0_g2_i1.p1 TRINITY_DN5566_c0_g2~~TRINITY_DN5566_c0_g2_i1.p1  ORF type:complete len:525 (+),score=88.25 TRINITY_DN5566_c0_g2_i1:175-1749(+)